MAGGDTRPSVTKGRIVEVYKVWRRVINHDQTSRSNINKLFVSCLPNGKARIRAEEASHAPIAMIGETAPNELHSVRYLAVTGTLSARAIEKSVTGPGLFPLER